MNPILSQAMKLQDKTLKEEEEEEEEEGEYEEALSSFYSPHQPEPVISIIKGDVQKGSGQLSRYWIISLSLLIVIVKMYTPHKHARMHTHTHICAHPYSLNALIALISSFYHA